jgi:hypothetical protein
VNTVNARTLFPFAVCLVAAGARLEYRAFPGIGGPAVARGTCTPGSPVFAIIGNDMSTGAQIEIDGANLDLALWP